MKFSNTFRFVGLFLLLSSPAHAIVIYESDAFSTFALLDTGGMIITITTPPEPSTTAVTGAGVASVDADLQIATPPIYTLESDVSGSADDPGGTSSATVLNGLFVELDNLSGLTPATAVFEFSYEWFTSITRTDPAEETAFASSFFHLTGFAPSGDETLAIDEGFGAGPVGMTDWLVNPAVGLSLGGSLSGVAGSGFASVLAYVTVPAGGFDSFSVLTGSFGEAAHVSVPVPAPSTLALLGLGLVGMAARRRRIV